MVCELEGPTPILKRSKTLVTKTNSPARARWARARAMASRRGPARALRPARRCARPAAGPASIASPSEIVETREPGEVRACLERLRGARPPRRRLHRLRSRPCAGAEACAARRAPPARRAALALVRPVRRLRGGRRRRASCPIPPRAWAGRPAAADRARRPMKRRSRRRRRISRPATSIRPISPSRPRSRTAGQSARPLRGDPARGRGPAMARSSSPAAHWLLSFSPELFFTLDDGRLDGAADEGHGGAARAPHADEAAARRFARIPSSAPKI